MSKYGPLKKGDKRSDGKIFWRYQNGQEVWITARKYKRYSIKVEKYYIAAREAGENVSTFPLHYQHPDTGLYFAGIYCGKRRWITYEQMLKDKCVHKLARRKYVEKQKALPPTTLKVGDRHPEDDRLYVIDKRYNQVKYGTLKQLQDRQQQQRDGQRRRAAKDRILKKKRLQAAEVIYKRGMDKNGLIFWSYSNSGREIWLQPDVYKQKQARRT